MKGTELQANYDILSLDRVTMRAEKGCLMQKRCAGERSDSLSQKKSGSSSNKWVGIDMKGHFYLIYHCCHVGRAWGRAAALTHPGVS